MYTLQQVITAAIAGNAVKVRVVDSDGYGIPIANAYIGGVEVNFTTSWYDLGKFHTAKMVLDSFTLRHLINAGTIEADAGTIGLSREPVV